MDVVKTGRDLSRTLKNANRLREVLSVFAKNGFDEIIQRTNLSSKFSGFVLPKSSVKIREDLDLWGSLGHRLRLCFEELGPGFIKIGQLIASREDIFDASFIEELKPLQAEVKALDFSQTKKVIELSFEKNLNEVFKSFNESAIATASIGCVYEAKLNSGDEVVVKVRKPNIKEVIETDFELFRFLVLRIEKISEDFKYLGLSRVIDDFHETIQLELNFNLEKLNLEKLKKNLSIIDQDKVIYIPKVYDKYCSERVLVLEKLNGKPFSKLKPDDISDDLKDKLFKSTHLFLHTILSDGFFHADLHGGNFFLLENGKIGLIDFGSMGHLSAKNKASLVSILYALTKNNYDHLVYEFLEIADYEEIPNHNELARDLQQTMAPFIGLTSQKVDSSLLTKKLVQTLMKHKMYLPREWYIIFRAIISLDGVGRSIGIDINAFEILEEDSSKIIKKLFSKDQLIEEGFWFGRDILNTMRIVPRHLSWFFKESAKNNYAFQVRNEEQVHALIEISNGLKALSVSLIFTCLMTAGIYFSDKSINELNDFSSLSLLFFICSVGTLLFLYRFLFLKK